MRHGTLASLLTTMAFAVPIQALSEELDPQVEAGKSIYLGETHQSGCERCHGPDGTAEAEGRMFMAERSIQGKTAQEIQVAIMATPMMWTIKLSEKEREQVAAYLQYLQSKAE